MTSVVKITEAVQALAAKIAAGADTAAAGSSPNHQLKAAMVAKGYFQAGQGGGIPAPYPDKKFLSNNGTELEWRTASPDVDEPTGDGDILIIKEGRPVWGNLIPKPYVADQVLSNNGTQLEWHDLPDDRLPPIDPGGKGKILVIENGVVEWRTLSSGGITLPDTTGQDGKLLTTNGAPLSEGGGLFWGVPAGAPGSGTPGSLIGYAQAYSTEEYTFNATVYPDFNGAIAAEQEVALAPVIQWGHNSVVTLDDGETPAGTWVEDGVFEFGRDCFATLYISQQAFAQFDETTGTIALPGIYVVHQRPFTLDGVTRYDSDIVGVLIGRYYTPPYGVNKPPPTIGGSTSCSLTASAGDLVSLRGLVTVFGGTGGVIRYGAVSASTRPNFGILIMEAFPGHSMPVPGPTPAPTITAMPTPEPTPTPVPTTTPVATPVPTTTPGPTPTPVPTPTPTSKPAPFPVATPDVVTAPDGITWNVYGGATESYQTWNISDVTYGNGKFVAVSNGITSSGGTYRARTSTDGVNWTAHPVPALGWAAVTFGGSLFVAVSADGAIMTSPDGVNWVSRTGPSNSAWASITYGNGTFVAVSGLDDTYVMTSSDGISWTPRASIDWTSPGGSKELTWDSVIYGNGLFVAVTDIPYGPRVMTSPDGISWTLRADYTTVGGLTSVAYGNGRYVAVSTAGDNKAYISQDGVAWEAHPLPDTTSWWRDVVYGDGLFVAVSRNGSHQVMTSPDGINWTAYPVSNGYAVAWDNITYGNGVFVAMSSSRHDLVMVGKKN